MFTFYDFNGSLTQCCNFIVQSIDSPCAPDMSLLKNGIDTISNKRLNAFLAQEHETKLHPQVTLSKIAKINWIRQKHGRQGAWPIAVTKPLKLFL